MKVIQDLTIEGEAEAIRSFLKDIISSSSAWKYEQSRSDSSYLAFRTPKKGKLPGATLFLHVNANGASCSVANIIPDTGELSVEAYNRILQAFYRDAVSGKVEPYPLTARLTPEDVFLEETLSPENMRLLQHFSDTANRSAGSSFPLDHQRWIQFIGNSARNGQILAPSLLKAWLAEQGWPEDIAADLVRDYQFGVDLITSLDEKPQGQDGIRVTR